LVKTISVFDLVGRGYSNDDGYVIQQQIKKEFSSNKKVVVSFLNIDGVTSSFVNTAFIELLNDYNFAYIKQNLSFIDSKKQINGMIKDRFNFEVNRRKNLVKALA
jgi:hypothetical protein